MASPGVPLEFRRPSAWRKSSGAVEDRARALLTGPAAGELVGEHDRELVALCRERGALRSVLARIAACLVFERAWERIGHARLSDYAVECLGLSGRSVRSLAEVGTKLRELPRLEDALVSGTLGWTKVRLLARLPREEDETRWIAHARRLTAEELSKAVRAVDRGSVEAGAAEDEGARSRLFEVRCTAEVRWKWLLTRRAAARVAGRALPICDAAELIAAEVLSALPIEEKAADDACEEAGVSWAQETDSSRDGSSQDAAGSERTEEDETGPARPAPRLVRRSLPPALEPLLEGLEDQGAFELDERFRRAQSLAQCLDARVGALLAPVWSGFLHRALGYSSREAYARERLGMDPTRARALVRLERASLASAPFARAYRTGGLSSVRASVLIPLLRADPLGSFVEDWVAWAGRVTVRRLREDVEQALALAETDSKAFRSGGGLPAEARDGAGDEREIGAAARSHSEPLGEWAITGRAFEGGAFSGGETRDADASREEVRVADDREIGAAARDTFHRHHPEPLKSAPDEVCWARFLGPPDVVQLFNAVLCTVRRRIERNTGRLPTAGTALPHSLRWELGIRPGRSPLLAYRSGDIRSH